MQDAVQKECYQVGQPPGGIGNDCRFDEFCACDFYELSVKKRLANTIKKPIKNDNSNFNAQISPRTKYKTYCRLGEKGICLHVCQLAVLTPGSCEKIKFDTLLFLRKIFDISHKYIEY